MVLAHNAEDGRRTRDIKIKQDVTFDSMLLSTPTLLGLKDSGFLKPSPVQLHGIPLGKCGFDLLLEAKSGTGKTAVFSIIALEKLDFGKGLQVVILAPTREIASQICDVIKQIGSKFDGLKVEVVMGGLPLQEDIIKFKEKVHIVVGSPGRLRHLIQDKFIDVSTVRLLVFDEADKLMEKSFQADINFIFSVLPHQKQVILSSATYTETTKSFVSKYVKSAQHICPDSDCILLGIDQRTTKVKFNANIIRQTQYKFDELIKILSNKTFKQCLIFCNYQARVTELYKLLSKQKWPVEQLYGQQEQTDRLDALKTLQEYKCRILISTDLAARGIDASNVDVVINFEPPFEWQTYLHRIGRAGRYGSYGMSITILSEGKEEKRFQNMLDSIHVPLRISALWNNGKIDSLSTDSQLQIDTISVDTLLNIETINKYKELWQEFTTNVTNEANEIENFDNLYKSFATADKKCPQSFNDLLQSYDNHQQTLSVEKSKYQHMQITSKAIKDLSELFNNLKYTSSDSKLKDDMFINTNSDVNETNNEDCLNQTLGKIQRNTEEDNFNQYKCSENIQEEKEQEGRFHDNDEDILYSPDELIKAGLPSSFGSNKANNKYARSNALSQKLKTNKLKHQKEKVENNNSLKKPIIENNYSHIATNTNVSKEPVYNNFYKKGGYLKNKKKPELRQPEFKDNLSENYINWYKQLKCRMKQIEMTLYIEEMSQLY